MSFKYLVFFWQYCQETYVETYVELNQKSVVGHFSPKKLTTFSH